MEEMTFLLCNTSRSGLLTLGAIFSFFLFLQTHAPQIYAGVNGGLSGGLCVQRPGSEDPHQHQRKFVDILDWSFNLFRKFRKKIKVETVKAQNKFEDCIVLT